MDEIKGTKQQLTEKYAHRVFTIGSSDEDVERARRAFARLTRPEMVTTIKRLLAKGR